ncbi:hypothetical protein BLNAU_19437 [Blattamonas nauphoetae]|uniref:Uncharacterized protein n=1 Tax=Blattamonas nauphoetae TaxID=2049346 RepID=A0ABQ9X5P1_9EUKA|nr:hypothetical protein BLNAU_19437 [Blattamonas nauphoetae]
MGLETSRRTQPQSQPKKTPPKPPPSHPPEDHFNTSRTEEQVKKIFKNPDKDSSQIDFARFASHITFYDESMNKLPEVELIESPHKWIIYSLDMLFTYLEPARREEVLNKIKSNFLDGAAMGEKVKFEEMIETVILQGSPVHLLMKTMTQVHMFQVVDSMLSCLHPPYMIKDAGIWEIDVVLPTKTGSLSVPGVTGIKVIHRKNQSSLPTFCKWNMVYTSTFTVLGSEGVGTDPSICAPLYQHTSDFATTLSLEAVEVRFDNFVFDQTATEGRKKDFLTRLNATPDEISSILN